jgi:CPA1 family monovalent cation:H+ antiporter
MIDFWLNGLLFLLLGLQFKVLVSRVAQSGLGDALLLALAICAWIVLLRFVWVYVAVYTRRLWRKVRGRAPKRTLRNEAFLISWTGMRGGVSLAAALAIPLALENGEPFPERDLIVFITFVVIILTLVVQGVTLPVVIRMCGLDREGRAELDEALHTELQARETIRHAALRRLDALTGRGEISRDIAEAYRHEMRDEDAILRYHARAREQPPGRAAVRDDLTALLEVIEAQREELLHLRRQAKIDDAVLHRIQSDLDLQELRLSEQLAAQPR